MIIRLDGFPLFRACCCPRTGSPEARAAGVWAARGRAWRSAKKHPWGLAEQHPRRSRLGRARRMLGRARTCLALGREAPVGAGGAAPLGRGWVVARRPSRGALRPFGPLDGLPLGATLGPSVNQNGSEVAVGTALTGGPPHRPQRAELPHWVPALGGWRRSGFQGRDAYCGRWAATCAPGVRSVPRPSRRAGSAFAVPGASTV